MNLKAIGRVVEKFVKENGPTLIMSAGLGFFGGAIITTATATVKSTKDVIEYNSDTTEELTPKEVVKREWKNYIAPAMLTTAGTACVICANHMNLVRIETLATAYALNKDKFKEYQDKVKEVFGEKKEMGLRDKIAQDHVTNDGDNPPWIKRELLDNDNPALIEVRDSLTGRRFKSTRTEIDRAVNEFNRYLITDGKLDLNSFYDILDLENIEGGDFFIWNSTDNFKPMEIDCHYVTGTQGQPVMEIEYKNYDVDTFRRIH